MVLVSDLRRSRKRFRNRPAVGQCHAIGTGATYQDDPIVALVDIANRFREAVPAMERDQRRRDPVFSPELVAAAKAALQHYDAIRAAK